MPRPIRTIASIKAAHERKTFVEAQVLVPATVQRVVLLTRVSTHEQEERETIVPQIDMLEGKAAGDNVRGEVVRIVDTIRDDGVSGTIPLDKRKDGFRLIAMVCGNNSIECDGLKCGQPSIDEVWVWKLDRLGRKASVIHQSVDFLDRHGVKFVCFNPSISSDKYGKVMLALFAIFAELEREEIADRTTTGRRAAVRKGKWKGGIKPFGWTTDESNFVIPDERLIDGVVPATSAAGILRGIVDRFLTETDRGGPSTTVEREALKLTAKSIPTNLGPHPEDPTRAVALPTKKTRADGTWRGNRIRDLMKNSMLAGVYSGNVSIPAIITNEEFDRLQQRISAHPTTGTKDHFYLLARKVFCGRNDCANKWTGTPSAYNWFYYRCNSAGDKFSNGCRSYSGIRQEVLDTVVWGKIEELLRNPDDYLAQAEEQLNQAQADAPARNRRLAEIVTTVAALRAQDEAINDLFRLGRYTRLRVREEGAVIDRQITDLEFERRQLERGQSEAEVAMMISNAQEAVAEYRAAMGNLSDARKQRIIDRVVTSVIVNSANLTKARGRFAKMDYSIEIVLDLGEKLSTTLADRSALADRIPPVGQPIAPVRIVIHVSYLQENQTSGWKRPDRVEAMREINRRRALKSAP